jgi:hypothetical protein
MDIKQGDLIRFYQWVNGGLYRNDDKVSQPTLQFFYDHAIPKLQEKGYTVILEAYEHTGFSVVIRQVTRESAHSFISDSDDPVEALYKAIMEVINHEK